MKQILFSVIIDNNEKIVRVIYDTYSYDALAVLAVRCLEHFTELNHEQSVDLYKNSTKSCREDSFSFDRIVVRDCDQSLTEFDLTITDPADFDPIEFWMVDK